MVESVVIIEESKERNVIAPPKPLVSRTSDLTIMRLVMDYIGHFIVYDDNSNNKFDLFV